LMSSRNTMTRNIGLQVSFNITELHCGLNATTSNTAGAFNYSTVDYTWDIIANDIMLTPSIPNESRDRAKFILSPYVLSSGFLYEIRLNASCRVRKHSELYAMGYSMSSVLVRVIQGPIVPLLSGASSNMVDLSLNSSLLLDASGSYDSDYPSQARVNSNFIFQWNCVQVYPFYKPWCLLKITIFGVTNVKFL